MSNITALKAALRVTECPALFFGKDKVSAKKLYLQLAKVLHPDNLDTGDKEAFQKLSELWDSYDESAPILLRYDTIANVYLEEGKWERKEAAHGDIDLLENELRILEKLRGFPDFKAYKNLYQMPVGGKLQYVPLGLLAHEVATLQQLKNFFGDDLDIRHLGWIWRRLIWALHFAHHNGIVHGMVTPDSVAISTHREGELAHNVTLINWYAASVNQTPLKTISNTWLHLYPDALQDPNITAADAKYLTLPGLDFYMAAQTMLEVFDHVMPDQIRQYFVTMAQEPISGVLTDAQALMDNFDTLIYRYLGWRKEFVKLEWLNWNEMG